jgi:hypothetical protein
VKSVVPLFFEIDHEANTKKIKESIDSIRKDFIGGARWFFKKW